MVWCWDRLLSYQPCSCYEFCLGFRKGKERNENQLKSTSQYITPAKRFSVIMVWILIKLYVFLKNLKKNHTHTQFLHTYAHDTVYLYRPQIKIRLTTLYVSLYHVIIKWIKLNWTQFSKKKKEFNELLFVWAYQLLLYDWTGHSNITCNIGMPWERIKSYDAPLPHLRVSNFHSVDRPNDPLCLELYLTLARSLSLSQLNTP